MESQFYQPASKIISINGQNFMYFDQSVAKIRAEYYFKQALHLISTESKSSESSRREINQSLLNAIDFSSKEAAFLLAKRIIENKTNDDFTLEDAIVFFGLAAELGHQEACYLLACCYRSNQCTAPLFNCGIHYFSGIDSHEREILADYYFQLAQIQ